ncbi:DMXL2 isoform 14, partial [Pan troglodytes]
GEGFLSIWQVNQTASNPKPYMSWQCHSKATSDFAFITSSSLVATSGHSNDNRFHVPRSWCHGTSVCTQTATPNLGG